MCNFPLGIQPPGCNNCNNNCGISEFLGGHVAEGQGRHVEVAQRVTPAAARVHGTEPRKAAETTRRSRAEEV